MLSGRKRRESFRHKGALFRETVRAARLKMTLMNGQERRDSINWLFVVGVGMSLMVAIDVLYALLNMVLKP